MSSSGSIRIGDRLYSGRPSIPQDVLTPEDEMVSDPEAEHATTRKVLRREFFPENRKDSSARVSVTLMHQRRGNADAKAEAQWLDVDAAKLSEVHKDEKVTFPLSGRETKRLFQALIRNYRLRGDLSVILAEMDLTLVDGTDVTVFDGPGKS